MGSGVTKLLWPSSLFGRFGFIKLTVDDFDNPNAIF